MTYAVQQRKLGVLLIGEYGTGKTFLSQVLKKMLPEDKFIFVFITNPRLNPVELTREIDTQLKRSSVLSTLSTKGEFLRSIEDHLSDYKTKGVHPVMIIDEAQSIESYDLLEEIRLLLNIQAEDAPLFTLILLGQPQLEEKIEKLPQLKQRLSIMYKLTPLNKEETREYVEFRMKVAGATRQVFTDSACMEIYALSKGRPRAINNICDLALLNGFIKKTGIIDIEMVSQVGGDLIS